MKELVGKMEQSVECLTQEQYNAEFHYNPYTFGKDGASVVGAHQIGFNNGCDWMKKRLNHQLTKMVSENIISEEIKQYFEKFLGNEYN